MTAVAGNIGAQYALKTAHGGKAERMLMTCQATIGAAGAVSAVSGDDVACNVTKNGGTGDYTFSFPTAPAGKPGEVSILSPAGTVKGYGMIGFDPTAGTLEIVTHNGAGTATNPATSDVLYFEVWLDVRG